jgi:mRNA interferase HigB
MRVRLIKQKTIDDFISSNASSKNSFEIWVCKLKIADWSKPIDIVRTFASADLLGNGSNRVVFDIAGNKYRMICTYYFRLKMVHLFVKWIGTHAEYTKLCNERKQFYVDEN